ncbi:MAG: alpha/beta hydrolase [Phenylobacterium sp.]|uniref:alpha/beta hydrolase n=1 Tax=Phenylobacterium sp. TaxID=1871053 RepID=UPI002724599A|nr:alpha/beta hydrolase [Phenylobacterium sp.]MDO8912935.1 alpha/beta hydrolase [Phenylobacterium sp.]MDP2012581.1 alpha/beta hydrolase [Phenylobacterium sp.]MDP3102074.1 alpha/beta hydrolase [Phenylobacterium sp.]MDP3870983.1 alpha/beta hydrolase [Phenylobacterium sp.]
MPSISTQRVIVRALLSLPSSLLRLLSGGGVVYRGGRTLDPRLQFLAAGAARGPAMTTLSPEEARRASAQGLAALGGSPEPGVRTEPVTIPTGADEIPARLYRPEGQDPAAPLMIFAHFGGGVIGDLETCDAFCGILARIARCPVLSVAYRLAPEHRFPAGLEDVLAAYRWGRDNAARFGAPAGRAAIGGDSMGGNFAAVVAQELKRAGEAQPDLQLLIYPCTDVASETASMTTYADSFPLSRATMDWFMGHYMGPEADPADPRLSPVRAPDLSGLAPAVVITAGFDPLVDQGEAYAKRLKDAGVPIAYRCYDSLAHGFTAFTGAVPCADVACREIAGLVREGLEGRIH